MRAGFVPSYTFGKFQCAAVVEDMLTRRNDSRYWRKFINDTYHEVTWLSLQPSNNSPKKRVTDFLRDERLTTIDERVSDDTKDELDFKTHLKNLVVTIFRAKVERPTEGYQKLCKAKKSQIASWKCKESHGVFVPFSDRIGYQEEMKWALIDIYADNGDTKSVEAGLNKLIADGRFHEIDKLFLNTNISRVRTDMLVKIVKTTIFYRPKLKKWDKFVKRVTHTLNHRKEDVIKELFGSTFEDLCEEASTGC